MSDPQTIANELDALGDNYCISDELVRKIEKLAGRARKQEEAMKRCIRILSFGGDAEIRNILILALDES